MILYLDASALVKRYVLEEETDAVVAAMSEADSWAICRVGYVEVGRALALSGGRSALRGFTDEWPQFDVIEVDEWLCDRALEIAHAEGLRSLDALHLAAASVLPAEELIVAVWDARLWEAARAAGLEVLPAPN